MTASVGLLDFFILEASDYVEHLDGLVASAGAAGPDADAFTKLARALRGSATMARVAGIAELAGTLERAGRAMREGSLPWQPALASAVVAAIDDLKILIRGVRTWGAAEDQRARTRVDELLRLAPQATRGFTATPTPTTAGGALFFAMETQEIATAVERLLSAPADVEALDALLRRVRAIRGVAAIRDLPPLPEVMEGVERAAKPLELGSGPLGREQFELLTAAMVLLRRASASITRGGRPEVAGAELQRFTAAVAALDAIAGNADFIVPIASLFFDDGGPTLVEAAPNPPTTPAERFRLEVVSQAEHLRRLAHDARLAHDPASRDRLARELRGALRALQAAAESFGEHDVAVYVAGTADAVAAFDAAALGALDEVAALLANPATHRDQLLGRLGQLAGRPAPAGGARGASGALSSGTPGRTRTPTGKALQALLDSGIESIGRLAERPLSQPVPIVDESVVPIETLLYRGHAALERAVEIRDALRQLGGTPSPEALGELFDLLDLAQTVE